MDVFIYLQMHAVQTLPCHLIDLFSMQVNFRVLIDLLCASSTAIKSPEIFLILLTCPLLQEDCAAITEVLPLAIIIADLPEKTLETLSKQLQQTLFYSNKSFCHRFAVG